jgi:hypothetical protein
MSQKKVGNVSDYFLEKKKALIGEFSTSKLGQRESYQIEKV